MQEMRLKLLHWESPWSSLDHHVKYNFIILLQRHQNRWIRRIFIWGSGVLSLHFIFIYHNYKMCWNSAGWPVYWLLTNARLSSVWDNQKYPIKVSEMNKTKALTCEKLVCPSWIAKEANILIERTQWSTWLGSQNMPEEILPVQMV